MAKYLHIVSIGMQTTAGYAYISLHSHGFNVVRSVGQIHVVLLGTF